MSEPVSTKYDRNLQIRLTLSALTTAFNWNDADRYSRYWRDVYDNVNSILYRHYK